MTTTTQMENTMSKYFLTETIGGKTVERQVSIEEFCKAERAAGFLPKLSKSDTSYMTTLATGGFFGNGIHGRIEYAPITTLGTQEENKTTDQHFEFTGQEIQLLRKHPQVLAILMDYHDDQQAISDSVWEPEDQRPQGNMIRRKQLYERGRSIMIEDLDIWSDELLGTFGFQTAK